MVNAYPYFAYRDNPSTVSLEYALLGNDTHGVHDPKGYSYTNMLDAQIDAIRLLNRDEFNNLNYILKFNYLIYVLTQVGHQCSGVWKPEDRDNSIGVGVAVEGELR